MQRRVADDALERQQNQLIYQHHISMHNIRVVICTAVNAANFGNKHATQ